MPAVAAPSSDLKEFLAAYPPAVRRLALRVREMLLERRPELVEKVWPGWKAVGYGTGGRMNEIVVGIGPAKAHVSVHLMNGASLPDPDGLLEGTSKTGRHVKITSVAQLESEPVQTLIERAFALHAAPKARAAPAPPPADWEPPVGDDAVAAKTGRSWREWVAALDAHGCATMPHKEIVAVVDREFGIGPWWQQMVTVGYERARGLREPHQTTAGYQVGASKTVGVGVDELWNAWENARTRARWLPDTFTVRKATMPKSMRITWHDGTDVQVMFVPKGADRSQVTVDHRKLPPGPRVAEMKSYWKERLDALKAVVEG